MDIVKDRDKVRRYYLNQDVAHVLHNGDILEITKGYRFDAHSVPLLLRWIFKPYNEQDIIAALVHDFLIDTKPWHRYSTKFINKEYQLLMEKHSQGLRRKLMPLAVNLWGITKLFEYRGEYKGNVRIRVDVEML